MTEGQLTEISQAEYDQELYENAMQAIHGVMTVRETDSPVTVSVQDGVVTVGGIVLNGLIRRQMLMAVAVLPGVKKVVDQVYADADMKMAIAQGIASSADLAGSQVEVHCYLGIITLFGSVLSEEQKAAAVKLASETAGVRQVRERLAVK